ncbi:MAG TPA: Tex family protein [Bdellovibrionota bacterium]|nr:Tex family protein [Bdellovibrionota bacterium]
MLLGRWHSASVNFEAWFQSNHPSGLPEASIPNQSIEAVLRLAAEGATVPFIARYRKEQTGNLDEVAVQSILEAKERWDLVLKRQEFILGEIDHQKKLTPELKEKIQSAFSMSELDDLYLPYKQKRKTKAALAKEAGLDQLADWIWNCGHGLENPQPGQTLEIWAFTFRNETKGYPDAATVIDGAQDILVERLSEIKELRQFVRSTVFEKGFLRSSKGEKAKPSSKYENYFSYHESISSLSEPKNSHRYLAVRRGWMEEELVLSIGGAPEDAAFDEQLLRPFEAAACSVQDSPGSAVLLKSARLALKAHVLPSIENEVHKSLKEIADQVAIQVFAENLRKLLIAPPFGSKAVLGVDPGIRTGCKVAVVDESGKYIASTVLHLQTESEKENAKKLLVEAVRTGGISAVAVGNGTAGGETELFIRKTLKDAGLEIPVVMVSESGASVYSASEVAREEFPDLDLTVRGAISIARRLQDPLAELVKVDPKSIGVGQYQHDVSPQALKRSLEFVVDSCVNSVGVNLNTASEHLLAHVSGIGPSLARAITTRRSIKGLFRNRTELLEIPRFSEKVFEQAAGFLRISDGDQPLDGTAVHPERYPLLEKLANRLNKSVRDLMGPGVQLVKADKTFAEELGKFTFQDVVSELEKPGRDPRDQFVPFQFRDDIHEVSDLKSGMVCPGIVTNVTNFGAFVDIGVHQDGLVHISQLSDRFIRDPREAVSPGDHVRVRVLEVNFEKKQISLTMKGQQAEQRAPRQQQERGRPDRRDDQQRPIRHGLRSEAKAGQERQQAPGRHEPQGKGKQPLPRKPSRPPKPVFTNNPFSALAGLKVRNSKPDPKSDR